MLTHRESRYVVERSKGLSKHQALVAAGFSLPLAKNPKFIESPEVLDAIEAYRQELVDNALHVGLCDAQEIHEYLTEIKRASVLDIMNPDGSYKTLDEWPAIWTEMWEGGDIEVEFLDLVERSNDGEEKEKRGGWDTLGKKIIRKVKFKFASKLKAVELLMKHKGVNAMVETKGPDVHVHLHAEIVGKLQSALARKQRLIPPVTEK